jgi:RNA polymerase sigma factor (sigma-70 family)
MPQRRSDDLLPPGGARFATTNWSMIVQAGAEESQATRAALSVLCQIYWYPLYAFCRRRGAGRHEAQDLVQGFFAQLLEKGFVAAADRERGRFRTFLLTTFRRHVSKVREHDTAQKRGGGRTVLSFDFEDGEGRYKLEPEDNRTPEAIFERRWALTLLARTLEALREQFRQAGREDRFEVLKEYLDGGGKPPSHREAGERLGLSEGAVKVSVHRLRKQYRALLRAEISQTVADPDAIDDEIRHLVQALAG